MNALAFLVTDLCDLPGDAGFDCHRINWCHDAKALDVDTDAASLHCGGADHGWPIRAKPAHGHGLFGAAMSDTGNQQYYD